MKLLTNTASRSPNNSHYSNDTTILANNIEDLQAILNKVYEYDELFGLQINIAKTKLMGIERHKQNKKKNRIIKIKNLLLRSDVPLNTTIRVMKSPTYGPIVLHCNTVT